MKRLGAVALLLAIPLALCLAELPVRTEQVVWSVLAYNGCDYSATFAPRSSDTIYLLADADSFLSARSTLVYFWPLTAEWKTDTDSLNMQYPGTIELRGRGVSRDIPLQEYTYFNVRGEYELNWRVLTGDSAHAEVDKYRALYESYFKATHQYQLASQRYDQELQRIAAQIGSLRAQGRDTSALLARMEALTKPEAPQAPSFYVVPPSDIQQAFVLNLPAGSYSMRLRNPDGTILEGSDRKLAVHKRSRSGGIGYEVIPSDKWTRAEQSVTPASVLYVNGGADLYLRPFFEDELNDLAYAKTVDNGAKGNPNIQRWVRTQQVPHAQIIVRRADGAASTIVEQPFLVEQSPGSSLGYTIAPWDPRDASKGKEPNLVAFRVPIDGSVKAISISAAGSDGTPLPGSQRQIRVVKGSPLAGVALALALLPLLAMVIVLVARARTYASTRSAGTP